MESSYIFAAIGTGAELKVLTQLQPRVNHRADAESNGSDAQVEASKVRSFFLQRSVARFLI